MRHAPGRGGPAFPYRLVARATAPLSHRVRFEPTPSNPMHVCTSQVPRLPAGHGHRRTGASRRLRAVSVRGSQQPGMQQRAAAAAHSVAAAAGVLLAGIWVGKVSFTGHCRSERHARVGLWRLWVCGCRSCQQQQMCAVGSGGRSSGDSTHPGRGRGKHRVQGSAREGASCLQSPAV